MLRDPMLVLLLSGVSMESCSLVCPRTSLTPIEEQTGHSTKRAAVVLKHSEEESTRRKLGGSHGTSWRENSNAGRKQLSPSTSFTLKGTDKTSALYSVVSTGS